MGNCDINQHTFANFGYPNNKVAIYRHDGHRMLQDVTDGNFVDPENLELVEGVLEEGSYSTDVDCFKDIAQSMEAQVQDKTGVVDVSPAQTSEKEIHSIALHPAS